MILLNEKVMVGEITNAFCHLMEGNSKYMDDYDE